MVVDDVPRQGDGGRRRVEGQVEGYRRFRLGRAQPHQQKQPATQSNDDAREINAAGASSLMHRSVSNSKHTHYCRDGPVRHLGPGGLNRVMNSLVAYTQHLSPPPLVGA